MKKIIPFLISISFIVNCKTDYNDNSTKNIIIMKDTTPKVTGVGGIFFFSDNPKELKDRYEKNLGFETNEYGSTFEFRNADRPDEINYLQCSPFGKGNEYFATSKKEFMINYRVQNIEGFVKNLKTNGVTILDETSMILVKHTKA